MGPIPFVGGAISGKNSRNSPQLPEKNYIKKKALLQTHVTSKGNNISPLP